MSGLMVFLMVKCHFYIVRTSKSLKKKFPMEYSIFLMEHFCPVLHERGKLEVIYSFDWWYFFPTKERLYIRVQPGPCIIYRYSNKIIVPRAKLEEIAWSWQEGSRFVISKLWITNDLYRLKKINNDSIKNFCREFSEHPEVC